MRNYKIAIVGAGPAGYFTAQALQNSQSDDLNFAIDIIERLPTPWGLVRSGVAPDHPKIKTVSKAFEKIAKERGFRLFANVELGKDISLKDLRDQYDAVVLTTGSPAGQKLGIPGEDLANVLSSADFVPWYNAHPDFTNVEVDLNTDTAVVIGAGNVAIDVARILAIDPSELEQTDIAEYAHIKLKQSKIRQVFICGRRAPEHATFTASELRDLLKLKNTDVHIDIDQISQTVSRIEQIGDLDKEVINKIGLLRLITEQSKKDIDRKLEIKFLANPIEIKGYGKVSEVIFNINEVVDGKVVATNKTFSIKTGLVITAVGYQAVQYPGIKIEKGRIANIAGRIEQNLYVAGWAKRGPNGVIGTNKSDSADVVDLLIKNLNEPKQSEGITSLLKSGHQIVDQIGWEKINAFEVISGELAGKPRIKEVDWNRLISLGTSQ